MSRRHVAVPKGLPQNGIQLWIPQNGIKHSTKDVTSLNVDYIEI
jgi:hypothetical protein